ncbi:MAG TPA: NAD(P)H-hydrate dehydratase [Desulfuromonadaceae bacterium]|nr:NAD(P)H-hydrate dehydratase [Desulfuromonadaceae bacterium]
MSIPVITVAQMREWETAAWAAGQTEAEVIRRVGQKLAARLLQLTRPGDVILILAGKGNNGNDVRAAVEHLSARRVELLNVHSPEVVLPRLQELLQQKPAWIVDGLFGIGLNRPLDAAWQQFINTVNGTKIPVLAMDAPSGLNADTGQTFGAAIEAAMTLTVGAPKAGMLGAAAWPFVGRLEVLDDVGLSPCPHHTGLNWIIPDDFDAFPPRRPVAGHKGTFGHLAIVAGSFGYHGAAVLAARGAQRAQPGLITVYTQENVYHPIASQLQSPMVNVWEPDVQLFEDATALLIGPGLAGLDVPDNMRNIVRRLWRDCDFPIVADATALDWLVSQPVPRHAIRVVTPHPGEAARMLNTTTQRVQANRLHATRELSKRFSNCRVVLKGHQTLSGRNDGEVFINPSGNPYLAQGGSGDVLAGFIAGWLAQPALRTDADQAIRYAVWQHGNAADRLQSSRRNWGVEDLLEELGNV